MTIKLLMPLEQIEDLANQIKRSNDPKFIEEGLKKIIETYDVISFECQYSRPYFRARVIENGKPFSNLSELTYPPKNLVKEGRVNEVGSPFLYLSFTPDTALAEIKVKEGDLVQLSGFLPKHRLPRAIILGEYQRVTKGNVSFMQDLIGFVGEILDDLEKKGRPHIHCFLYPDLFFDEILRMPNASETKYIHSRILTKLLMNNSNDPDGIVYHSIADLGSYNIALPAAKADELMKCDQTALIKVKRVFSYGIFDFDIIKISKGFTENGNILW
ncbi:MAG: hypothetical protein CME25_23905 [Gemmatimonadetes bacterium]|nr:hypothetical protein [Gemmatimonadota bacterium]